MWSKICISPHTYNVYDHTHIPCEMVYITTHMYHVNPITWYVWKNDHMEFRKQHSKSRLRIMLHKTWGAGKAKLESRYTNERLSSSVINTNFVTSLILQEKHLSRFLLLLLADDSSGSSSPSSFSCHGDSTLNQWKYFSFAKFLIFLLLSAEPERSQLDKK